MRDAWDLGGARKRAGRYCHACGKGGGAFEGCRGAAWSATKATGFLAALAALRPAESMRAGPHRPRFVVWWGRKERQTDGLFGEIGRVGGGDGRVEWVYSTLA